MNKSIFASKTFWLQVAALVAAMFPQVQGWLASNPVEFVAVLGALNVIVRFLTSGGVSIFSGANGIGFWFPGIVALSVGTASVLGLASCSAGSAFPLKACVVMDHGTLCYSAKDGITAAIDARSGK